jgi:hypothetical protein
VFSESQYIGPGSTVGAMLGAVDATPGAEPGADLR